MKNLTNLRKKFCEFPHWALKRRECRNVLDHHRPPTILSISASLLTHSLARNDYFSIKSRKMKSCSTTLENACLLVSNFSNFLESISPTLFVHANKIRSMFWCSRFGELQTNLANFEDKKIEISNFSTIGEIE